MSYVYLASPYSHADERVRIDRYRRVCRAAGLLVRQGVRVFCPIAHSCGIAVESEMDVMDWSTWRGQDIELLRRADAMYVLTLPGWWQSVGVNQEAEVAELLEISIWLMREDGGIGMERGKWADMVLAAQIAATKEVNRAGE